MVILPNVSNAGDVPLTLLRRLAKWNFTIVDRVLFYYQAIRLLPVVTSL